MIASASPEGHFAIEAVLDLPAAAAVDVATADSLDGDVTGRRIDALQLRMPL